MIVVNIELLPGGAESLRRTIATMRVSNASDLADLSNYRVTAVESASPLTGHPAGIAECEVVDHDRRQRVWSLLRKACEEIEKAGWIPLQEGREGDQT
jgi:hypothetical protein